MHAPATVTPNPRVNRTRGKLRLLVPSALRAPVTGYLKTLNCRLSSTLRVLQGLRVADKSRGPSIQFTKAPSAVDSVTRR